MKCDPESVRGYFEGRLSREEIGDCELPTGIEPIDVASQIIDRGDVDRPDAPAATGDLGAVDEPDPEPVETVKPKCPCQEPGGNPLLWLAAGVALGYMLRDN